MNYSSQKTLKKYAYYISENRQVSVDEAIYLRDKKGILQTHEKPVFFDSQNPKIRAGIFPRKSSINPHFVYFSENDQKYIIGNKEMTDSHRLFQEMFNQLGEFWIEIDNKPIKVVISDSILEYYIDISKQDKKYLLVDVIVKVIRTEPASYKYLWNSILAIEIAVSHKVEGIKKKYLNQLKLATYEVNVPKVHIKKIENKEMNVNYLVSLYSRNENYRLWGNFISKSQPNSSHIKEWEILSQFEKEVEELTRELNQLKGTKTLVSNDIARLNQEKSNINKQISMMNGKYEELTLQIQKKNEDMNRLDSSYQTNIHNQQRENDQLREDIKILESENIWSFLKRKYIK